MQRIIIYSGSLYFLCNIMGEPDIIVAAWMMVGIAVGYVGNQKKGA